MLALAVGLAVTLAALVAKPGRSTSGSNQHLPLYDALDGLPPSVCTPGKTIMIMDNGAVPPMPYTGVAYNCPEARYGCIRDHEGRAACGDVL